MQSVIEKLQSYVEQTPDKLLYSFLDISGDETERYTYLQFMQRVDVIASHLHYHHSFKGNSRILLAYPPGVEMICAFFACAKLGLIPVPVYPPTSNGFQAAINKISYIAKDCQATAVLTSKEYYWSFQLNISRNHIAGFALTESFVSKMEWICTEDFTELVNPNFHQGHSEIFFLQYTSGSTSDPKGVMVSHRNILYNCNLVSDHLPVCVSWLPQYHDMGLIGYYIFCALQGGTTYGFSSIDFIQKPSLWLETISKYGCTASSAPNFAYEYCLQPGKISEAVLAQLDLSTLEFLMTAAEPVRPATYDRFLKFFAPYGLHARSYFAAYGLAENTLAVTNKGTTYLALDKASLNQNKLKTASPLAEEDTVVKIMSCGGFLGDNTVRIVNPDTLQTMPDGQLGEIWVTGQSKCLGYWNKPELTKQIFNASITGENQHKNNYLRTGDIGFVQQDELYICGRVKDMIIVRGLNYFPHDIEKIVEDATELVRKGCIAAFGITENDEEKLVVLAGLKNSKAIPDCKILCEEIRKNLNINTHYIGFVMAKEVPKTSSGKIKRHQIKHDWQEGKLNLVSVYTFNNTAETDEGCIGSVSPFDEIKEKYGFKGDETVTLGNALDSLDLVVLMHDIKELLKDKGAAALSNEIDMRLVQEISISELLELGEQFENSSAIAIIRLKRMLHKMQLEHTSIEQRKMLSDAKYTGEFGEIFSGTSTEAGNNILLTGGTGFLGPFILKSLLEQTNAKIYVLVRAANHVQGMERIKLSQQNVPGVDSKMLQMIDERVIPLCGNLDQPKIGLDEVTYRKLSQQIDTIYHNGALVNYLFNYYKMRNINVIGTNELIKLAFEERPKIFNHISTTFIFGWAVKDVLYEGNSNDDIDLLDFGYSQTKWASEQVVFDAMSKGLNARIFRPALISPSIEGGGHNFDISIRLIAFMIKYGIGVDAMNQVSFTPVDIAGNNIVAICNEPGTINKTYHVTRDFYCNMTDITNIITELTGQPFRIYKLDDFVPEVLNRCTREDLLFPLLDFLVRSVDKINGMEFKRYDSTNYQRARGQSANTIADPSLRDTVKGIILFLEKNNIKFRPVKEYEFK
ncbi:MAG: AMP-binding protein [Chitinophagaceae bacterium]|nr:AMP-binding protein [Chitinophagaceae bacterium]